MTEVGSKPPVTGDTPAAVPGSPGDDVETTRPATLLLAALGVVYGDIGTSPLYTLREAFGETGGLAVGVEPVLGVLSLVFWALAIVVSLKYVVLIMRADNRGEGGVLSLVSLVLKGLDLGPHRRALVIALSMVGLALFYGDGLITPAISVLSAVEGLELAIPRLAPYVVPIALAILVGLFAIQRRGTAQVGKLFGPVMCLWFATLAVLGLIQVGQEPTVLQALNPIHALRLFATERWGAFIVLGAVVLAVTGAEALYADMGHFGRQPIRRAWFGLVLPALLLNYFGQGALLIGDPAAIVNPFYLLAPGWALLPLLLLATSATIIASQAVISGAFSLTRQAIQLGYLPRMEIRHTSAEEIGQIYIPRANWLLLTGIVVLVVGFGSSSNLAAAYGISVTAAMAVDTILVGLVALGIWRWRPSIAIAVCGVLLLVDLAFFGANALKIPTGGWLPLVVAAALFAVMSTWRRGREVLRAHIRRDALPVATLLERADRRLTRVAGTAVFMTPSIETVPRALLHNLKHNKVLHERVVLMTVLTEEVPRVPERERLEVARLGKGVFTVVARFGFMERPNVPQALEACRAHGLAIDLMETSFFLSRETLLASSRPDLSPWRERIFIAMSATALSATDFFCIPPGRVVEMGTQIEI